MEYCRKYPLTDKSEAAEYWRRFKSDIESMPSVSIVKIELILQTVKSEQGSKSLIWNQGLIKNEKGMQASVKDLREKLIQDQTDTVTISYKLNAPNRDIAYVLEILSLVQELHSLNYKIIPGCVLHVEGNNRFGSYWTEMSVLTDDEIQHSGVRPSPLSRFATIEPIRHTTTGW
jgi:hypothetical protein